MTGSAEMIDNQKIIKFNTDYSHLSNLILNMTEEQHSLLLEEAHRIINKKEITKWFTSTNWIFILGFLLGWIFTTFLVIFFEMI